MNAANLGMEQIGYIRDLAGAVKLALGDSNPLALGLVEQIKLWADYAHNDLDGFREGIELDMKEPAGTPPDGEPPQLSVH